MNIYDEYFFFSSRRRHTRYIGDWSSDVCSSDLPAGNGVAKGVHTAAGIERGAIGDGKNDTRGADGGADGARRDDAHAHSTGSLIASKIGRASCRERE